MSRGFERGRSCVLGHVLYRNAGSPDISTPERSRETRDFMSRNSLGSPTFMFYPVIMMSTYTSDKTKHYPCSFSPSSFLSLSAVFVPPPPHFIIGIRPRRGNATHFCEERKRSMFKLWLSFSCSYFVKCDASVRAGDACRLRADGRILIAAAILAQLIQMMWCLNAIGLARNENTILFGLDVDGIV